MRFVVRIYEKLFLVLPIDPQHDTPLLVALLPASPFSSLLECVTDSWGKSTISICFSSSLACRIEHQSQRLSENHLDTFFYNNKSFYTLNMVLKSTILSSHLVLGHYFTSNFPLQLVSFWFTFVGYNVAGLWLTLGFESPWSKIRVLTVNRSTTDSRFTFTQ